VIYAEMICAWFAGVVLGWRLGLHHRGVNDELRYWVTATSDGPAFDWAKEPGL
jgi:hypothetical protein